MDRARGQLHVQKAPRWRLTIKNLQEDVEVARRRESLRSSRPEQRRAKGSLSRQWRAGHPGRWNLNPRPELACMRPRAQERGRKPRVGWTGDGAAAVSWSSFVPADEE